MLRSHAWKDGYTAFHSGTGDTHLLDHLTGEVLSCLLRQPLSLEELTSSITGKASAELDSDSVQAFENALASLQRVQLIEPVHP
ncbi:MAG: HPr-rel-A system PqqD family peptide chaperone [Burkholderiales bacterium]|nr:HPr-rel-A system PqqD family peptide chaperone [Burkholderiales bacterium]